MYSNTLEEISGCFLRVECPNEDLWGTNGRSFPRGSTSDSAVVDWIPTGFCVLPLGVLGEASDRENELSRRVGRDTKPECVPSRVLFDVFGKPAAQ